MVGEDTTRLPGLLSHRPATSRDASIKSEFFFLRLFYQNETIASGMRLFYFFLFIQLFYLNAFGQPPQTLRIDPAFASGVPVSQVFEEVNYIPLETTKESLFGTINQLEIIDQYFIIFDRSTNAILLFEKNGKFHAKISGKGADIFSFDYEKENRRIRIFSTNNKQLSDQVRIKVETDSAGAIALMNRFIRVAYYDLDGKVLKINTSKNVLTPANLTSVYLPDGISFSNFALAGEDMQESQAYELNLYKDGKIYQSYFPYSRKKDVARYGRYLNNPSGFSRSQNDTVFYFTRPLDYSIFELTPHTIREKYRLIFLMKNTFPETFLTDRISQNDRRSFIRDNPSLITGLSNIHERKDRLFFKINNSERRRSGSTSLLYNLKTGQLISINNLTPDSTTSFLPVFDFPFSYESFKAVDESYFYTYISSMRMFQAKEGNSEKNISYPLLIEQYFQKGDKKDNPVIVQLKPKINP